MSLHVDGQEQVRVPGVDVGRPDDGNWREAPDALGLPPEPSGQDAAGTALDRHRGSRIDWPAFWTTDHADKSWTVEPILPCGRAVAMYAPAPRCLRGRTPR